jgi:hypothetical protein
MVRVVTRPPFSVYVYAETGAPHHLPHCDVRRGNEQSTQVALPTLQIIVGEELPRWVHRLLEEHLDEIVAAWNRLNSGRSIL